MRGGVGRGAGWLLRAEIVWQINRKVGPIENLEAGRRVPVEREIRIRAQTVQILEKKLQKIAVRHGCASFPECLKSNAKQIVIDRKIADLRLRACDQPTRRSTRPVTVVNVETLVTVFAEQVNCSVHVAQVLNS